ncbi:hypothetical protein HC761_00455, partial [bacterium]|nr:hypothetical protein [bacterium]
RGALDANPPPLHQNRRPKIFYATQVGSEPPTVVMFCNEPKAFAELAARSHLPRSAVTGILSGSLQKVTIDRVLRLVEAARRRARPREDVRSRQLRASAVRRRRPGRFPAPLRSRPGQLRSGCGAAAGRAGCDAGAVWPG